MITLTLPVYLPPFSSTNSHSFPFSAAGLNVSGQTVFKLPQLQLAATGAAGQSSRGRALSVVLRIGSWMAVMGSGLRRD